ncbi:hypothetical protein DPMN_072450 [Dreissena polymorpha]|uniref:Uncharacterized protein n=1 Tax=Dreissena polymorpha TaxID=45954 RepID=A0A9D4BWV4_DREPO|nr:hypothetical protein DPMN_072450 [Dreissena polymorpha]
MSDNPDAFIIDFWCSNRYAIGNGFCGAHWFVQIVIEPEHMNNPPMYSLIDELYRKLGLCFYDPRNIFLWECYGKYVRVKCLF